MKFLVRSAKASGSYSSLDRCVPQGDRLAPQVIHRPCTLDVSTLWYLTSDSLPVLWSWSSVSTAIGDGSLPYMSVLPSCAQVVYSNCTTANTGLPLTPSTLALATVSSEVPSGESLKNCRGLAATVLSMMGWLLMS